MPRAPFASLPVRSFIFKCGRLFALVMVVSLAGWGCGDSSGGHEGLYPAQIGERLGFIDRSGTIVINPQFDDAEEFSEGLARVAVGDKVGYIDDSGAYVINPQFNRAGNFSGGLAWAETYEELGITLSYVDREGTIVFTMTTD